jgi:ribosomal protein L7Ae-like RNA K-turn-binding protein
MDTDHLPPAGQATGLNQSLKLIRAGKAKRVLLAYDADEVFKDKVVNAAAEYGVPVDMSRSSDELSKFAGIDVPAAVVTYTA